MVAATVLVIALGACSSPGGNSPSPKPTVKILGNSNAVSLQVAQDQGFYEGVNVEVTRAGHGDQNSIFFSGGYEVNFGMATWEVAGFVSQGEKLKYFSPVGSAIMWNGVLISTSNANEYKDINDLRGKRLGIPGFGTGTYAAFTVLLKARYGIDDPTEAFEIVEADGGALLALVEKGEIDGALNFGEQTLAALSQPDKFTVIFSFSKEWEEETGQPMVISGLGGTTEWLDANPGLAKAIVDGSNKGLQWMRDNPEELTTGGKYAEWFDAAGVLADPVIAKAVLDKVHSGEFFSSGEIYTQEWIDSQYKFIEGGVGAIVDALPPKDDIFYSPDKLK